MHVRDCIVNLHITFSICTEVLKNRTRQTRNFILHYYLISPGRLLFAIVSLVVVLPAPLLLLLLFVVLNIVSTLWKQTQLSKTQSLLAFITVTIVIPFTNCEYFAVLGPFPFQITQLVNCTNCTVARIFTILYLHT